MRLLLDSHVVVWWSLYPGRLRPATRMSLIASDNKIFISAANVWELGLKIAKKQLALPTDYVAQLLADGIDELPVTVAHAQQAVVLPPLHGDPFDRILIAQALVEGLMLVTTDRMIHCYDVPVMEA